MSRQEPGLDLHEWETRWSEIEDALAEDPADALVQACDEIEALLQTRGDDEAVEAQLPELRTAFVSARDVADGVERGDEVDPGDIGGAIENLRAIRDALVPEDLS
ncbi:MAG: hypothetical protein ACRDNB_03665 [Gaiellaceae bacterium]